MTLICSAGINKVRQNKVWPAEISFDYFLNYYHYYNFSMKTKFTIHITNVTTATKEEVWVHSTIDSQLQD